GGTAFSTHAFLGRQAGSEGYVTVTGENSSWTLGFMTVGDRGYGRLVVSDSATVDAGAEITIGLDTTGGFSAGTGDVEVSGAGTTVTALGVNVGVGGTGHLLLQDGATLITTGLFNSVGGTGGFGGTGTALVTGSGTT